MASTDAGHAGFSSATNPHRLTRALWLAAVVVAACYGVFLVVTALRLPSGAELTGQFWLQPAVKATAGRPAGRRRADPPDRQGTTLADRRAGGLRGG